MNQFEDFLKDLGLKDYRKINPPDFLIKKMDSVLNPEYKYIEYDSIIKMIEVIFPRHSFQIINTLSSPFKDSWITTVSVRCVLYERHSPESIIMDGIASVVSYSPESIPIDASIAKTLAIKNAVRDLSPLFGRGLNKQEEVVASTVPATSTTNTDKLISSILKEIPFKDFERNLYAIIINAKTKKELEVIRPIFTHAKWAFTQKESISKISALFYQKYNDPNLIES